MRFRKKPVVIEAWHRSHCGPIPQWVRDAVVHGIDEGWDYWMIGTLEGRLKSGPDDFLIRGVAGEVYPCRSDVFAQTYEPVTPRDGADDEQD